MVAIPTARDAMEAWDVTLTPDTDVMEAIDALVSRRAHVLPVVNEQEELVGLLTEKDCLRVLSYSAWGEPFGGKVGSFMSPVKATVRPDMDLFGTAMKFLETNFPVLPVLEHGRLVGCISRQDLLDQIKELNGEILKERMRELEEPLVTHQPTSINELQKLAAKYRPEELAVRLSNRHKPPEK